MKKIVLMIIVTGLVVAFALPAMSRPQGANQLSFSGKTMPKVDFDHQKHKGLVNDCKECHHLGVGNGECTDCHGRDGTARGKKKAFHGSCKGCHSERGISGRKDCNFCHRG